MTTDTQTEKSEWKKPACGSLPPLVILEQKGEPLMGVLKSIDEVEMDGYKKKEKEIRTFYRFELTNPLQTVNKDKEDVSYKQGSLVSLPGSGHLDYLMRFIACEIKGTAATEENVENPSFEIRDVLVGREFQILRLGDDVMDKGAFKGKKVKRYEVGYK